MPDYHEGMIVDRDHVICPDNRIRRWHSSSRDPFAYETLLGLEYGRIKMTSGISVAGWRKDRDQKFIPDKSRAKERMFELRTLEVWFASRKSEDQLQQIARRRREQIRNIEEYEAIKPIDKNNTLPAPDYSFQEEDPLPLPY